MKTFEAWLKTDFWCLGKVTEQNEDFMELAYNAGIAEATHKPCKWVLIANGEYRTECGWHVGNKKIYCQYCGGKICDA